MSSGFISESEIEERKKIRQKEWEKVRKPNQPLQAPEEEYDHRSLFERLQEQKQKREFEYEESHRLKHMIKGLDDDEVEFLDLVDRSKLEEERKMNAEEAKEMEDFRNRVASLQEQTLENRIQQEIKAPTPPISKNENKISQTQLLAGAVIKKRPFKNEDNMEQGPNKRPCTQADKEEGKIEENPGSEQQGPLITSEPKSSQLPGLTHYEDSSDNEENDAIEIEPDHMVATEPPAQTGNTDPPVETATPESSSVEGVKDEPVLQCTGILPALYDPYETSDSSSDDSDSSFDTDSGCSMCQQ